MEEEHVKGTVDGNQHFNNLSKCNLNFHLYNWTLKITSNQVVQTSVTDKLSMYSNLTKKITQNELKSLMYGRPMCMFNKWETLTTLSVACQQQKIQQT